MKYYSISSQKCQVGEGKGVVRRGMRIQPVKSLGCLQDPHPRLHQQAESLPAEQGLVPALPLVLPRVPYPQFPSIGTATSQRTTVSVYGLIGGDSGAIYFGSALVAMGGVAGCAVMHRFKYVYGIVRSACGVVEMGYAVIKHGYGMIVHLVPVINVFTWSRPCMATGSLNVTTG